MAGSSISLAVSAFSTPPGGEDTSDNETGKVSFTSLGYEEVFQVFVGGSIAYGFLVLLSFGRRKFTSPNVVYIIIKLKKDAGSFCFTYREGLLKTQKIYSLQTSKVFFYNYRL